MPVIEIRALPQPRELDVAAVLGAVTRAVAELLGEPATGSWATWEEIPPGRYSEGGAEPAEQPPETHPPLVRVTAYEGRPATLVAAILRTVAETVAAELQLAEGNVFVVYEEATPGRLYTGGRVLGAP
jgi:phenylpyruvate tautomerase PptA (4-oxalocrotonate tautomerase family)